MIIGTLYGNSREKLHACKARKIVAAGERRTSEEYIKTSSGFKIENNTKKKEN
jgi:hypothetical protein